MRLRLPLALALFAVLSAPTLAGGAGAPLPLMPFAETVRFSGPSVPLVIDVDFSRVRVQRDGPLLVLVTAVTPNNQVVNLDSRPVRAGERLSWTGQIPARGVLVIRVLSGGQGAILTQIERDEQPFRVVVTGDEKGNFGVSDGHCPPRTNGICSGPRSQ
ncbi:hypothetical protein L1280_003012 [Deinococcus sp. HSC-46F16]|uniref:hypothetical protein n=1 Tax=Deinococcus sp. HSC-46F16 TaxID=2910968 RepID=UPI0020A0895C|nr:hypothetical protein [Deinococcus sp. HSC-46F16]MCP2015835.1 hypothetical protein [Deinococcus sp. HSC-46F16]